MKAPALAVAYREVRHFRPDDWLHCERLAVRGVAMDWTIPAHRHDALHQLRLLSAGAAEAVLDDVVHLCMVEPMAAATTRAPRPLLRAAACTRRIALVPRAGRS